MRLRPYSFFFVMTLAVLAMGYWQINKVEVIDLSIRDTYFVEALKRFYGGLAFLLFGLWCIYALTDRYLFPLHKGITWIHVACTIAGIAGYLFFYQSGYNFTVGNEAEQKILLLQGSFLVFLVGQLMFPINIFRSVILRARNRHEK